MIEKNCGNRRGIKMIRFENVSKTYDDQFVAVDALNFEIKTGEFFVIIGPSGSGKTTTLKMINRLIPLSSGNLLIDGKKISEYNIHELRWNIGYVLQQIALFPHLSIEENITIVPELKGCKKEEMGQRSDELLKLVGLDPIIYRDRKPRQLSGGEQQRVGVIRALAADPEILLMDEPFSALDPISREKLQDNLLEIKKVFKKTTVFVTHDINEALKLGDRICIMKEGKIVQIGTPQEIMYQPINDFVTQFVGNEGTFWHEFQLEDILSPLSNMASLGKLDTVSIRTPLDKLTEKLAEHNQLQVEKEGQIIGMIDRKNFIRALAKNLGEGSERE